jgi:hypothetical protein
MESDHMEGVSPTWVEGVSLWGQCRGWWLEEREARTNWAVTEPHTNAQEMGSRNNGDGAGIYRKKKG